MESPAKGKLACNARPGGMLIVAMFFCLKAQKARQRIVPFDFLRTCYDVSGIPQKQPFKYIELIILEILVTPKAHH